MPHRFLDHTADVAVELRARSREELFEAALAAFTDTVTELEGIDPDPTAPPQHLEASADDEASLMVEWLGELVYRFDVDGLLFRRAEVTIEPAADGGLRLTAEARGESYDEERHPLKVAVKGVTWHGLEVREEDDGSWLATVVFDI